MIDYSASDSNSNLALFQKKLVVKVYAWMTLALAITGFTSLFVASSPGILNVIYGSKFAFWGLLIAELVLVFVISGAINKMSSATATLLFFLYSVLNGVTMAFIFLVYTKTSIATTFFITAGTFGLMALFGYFTKKDLTRFGNLLIMALFGVILAVIVNIFLKSSSLNWIITIVGIFVFVGLVAYDTQKIKQLASLDVDDETRKKLSVIGALSLYLDFINLFLLLLQLFGGRRD